MNNLFANHTFRRRFNHLRIVAWPNTFELVEDEVQEYRHFLSVRDDALAKVVGALRAANVRAAIATGAADVAALGALPDEWLVEEFLPQITLLKSAALGITHGGNNSVTEALTFGVPLVVLPFSTDQFAGAEALERAGFGAALAPNEVSVDELKDAVQRMLSLDSETWDALRELGHALRQQKGHHALMSQIRQSDPLGVRLPSVSRRADRI